ncbi:hypothetical protein [Lentzea fradiae]|uniref:hypothetical protein n=1 Tax=Lentzea fradiae TaxID=200378 RepID=UPI00115FE241|nr:hypothetical protein [Lentzea fradiae]
MRKSGRLGFANPAFYARHHEFNRAKDNPLGTRDTVVFAINDHETVELVTPGRWEDADLVFAPGHNTATGLGTPTRRLLDSFPLKR